MGLNSLKLKPKQYIFTDSHNEVLNQLNKNISYNCNESNKSNNSVIVKKLDWCNLMECDLFSEHLKIDVLLASDIIFDPDIIPSLVETIKFLTNLNNNMNIIISSTIRNESTYNCFLQNLSKYTSINIYFFLK